VLDASAAVDFLVRRGPRGDWAAETVQAAESLHAPHLVDLEVISTLRLFVGSRYLPQGAGKAALVDFEELPIDRYPAGPFFARIWELRRRLTSYDAAYVALAEALDLPLVTTDGRLGRTRGHRAEIVAYPG
jgi:predicted nucleic acid-binding protein